jgi:Tol biopolymer transport system component
VAAALAIAGGSGALVPGVAGATAPGADGLIAFERDGDIWTVSPDGTGASPLVATPARESAPAWSPDGRRIAFARDGAIWVADADGSGQRVVADDPRRADGHPAWSPDGELIAFSRRDPRAARGLRGGKDARLAGLWSVRADGSGERALTAGYRTRVEDPDWHPGGARIAFSSRQTRPWSAAWVWQVGAASGAPALVAAGSSPSWSPDGRALAIGVGTRDRHAGAGAGIALIGGGSPRLVRGGGAGEPSFSPEGGRIAFVQPTWGRDGGELWVMRADGSGARRIAGRAVSPDWQPVARRPGEPEPPEPPKPPDPEPEEPEPAPEPGPEPEPAPAPPGEMLPEAGPAAPA